MRRLWIYLRKYKKECVLGPLFKLLEACFELLIPLVVAQIIDVGIADGDISYVLKMGGLMVLLGVIGMVSAITAQYFAARAAVGGSTAMRKALFAKINTLSYSTLDKVGSSTLITRITSDMDQVQTGINMTLRLLLRSPFIVFGAMIMAFTIDFKSALIFACVIPVLLVVVFAIIGITIPRQKKSRGVLDRVTLHVRENITGVRVVRAFNMQEEEKDEFHSDNRLLTSIQSRTGLFSALLNPLTYCIINAALIVLLWTGAFRVDAGILTQGQMVALVNYISQILTELIKMANFIVTLTKGLASLSRVNSVFDLASGMEEGTSEGRMPGGRTAGVQAPDVPAVEFRNVSFAYSKGGGKALDDISFKAAKGETIGIIGGTGAGKTTLVNLIPRFYDVSEGTVLFDGVDVRDYTYGALRGKTGVVPQKAVLFAGTLRDNLRFGKKDASDEEMMKALETAQGLEIIENREEGLAMPILQGGKNLSGGQRQRLTIARALVRDPDVLILDDSSSALDFATDAALRAALRAGNVGRTVFIVSQRVSSIKNADRIIVLDGGRMVGIGTHEELLDGCLVYREICRSQNVGKEAAS